MSDEVDPRLVALGLAPAPTAPREPVPAPGWEDAAPPPMEPAKLPLGVSGPRHLTVGDLFPGMGKYTGMPAEESAPPRAPAQPTFVAPAAPIWTVPQAPPPPPPKPTPSASAATAAPIAPPEPIVISVAPPPPEAPTREAPPPLPPLAAAMPTPAAPVVTPTAAPPARREREKRDKKEERPRERTEQAAKPERKPLPVKAPQLPKVERVHAPRKPRYQLPPSGVLLRGPVVVGFPERATQITLEQLGFRIGGKDPIDVAWSDVREIKARRGKVVVRTKAKPVSFGIPIDGVSEPTLAAPLARVVKEASSGSLDLAGSAFLELQNATDSLKDHYHDEDDPLIPTVVGLVFGLAGLTITALLPDAIAIATRTPVTAGDYLLDSPLAAFDPRILAASFAASSMLAAGVVRVAMGKAATAWARGTLRGWKQEERRVVQLARKALAAIVVGPAVAAAVLLAAIVLTLPTTRVQTTIHPSGFHVMRAIPLFDDDRPWSSVVEITTVPAPTAQHFEGIAVVFRFADRGTISTLDQRLRGGTDKQLFQSTTVWCRDGGGCR